MRVLLILSALILFTGCNEPQALAGPWEMWVLVCSPAGGDSWNCDVPDGHLITWAAVPGSQVRCELTRNGETVMEIFDWRDREPCEYVCTEDLSELLPGDGYRIVIQDDQGFFGQSGEFSLN